MASLQIDDVPDAVLSALTERAQAQGQSVADLVRDLMLAEARRTGDRALLERLDAGRDGSGLFADQVTQVVRQARSTHGTDGGASPYSWSTA